MLCYIVGVGSMITATGFSTFSIGPCSRNYTISCVRKRFHRLSHLFPSMTNGNFQYHPIQPLGVCAKYHVEKLKATSEESKETEAPSNSVSLPENTETEMVKGKPKMEEGQTTAILTGAIAITLGIAYLILVQLLDTRGIKLEPPPPEAFTP